jgi:hypothetical protein
VKNFSVTSLGAFLGALAAVVVLLLKGQDVGPLLAILAPVLGSLFVVGKVDARSDAQDSLITTIHENTNGRLTQRIREESTAAIRAVLAERDAAAGADVEPAQDGAATP